MDLVASTMHRLQSECKLYELFEVMNVEFHLVIEYCILASECQQVTAEGKRSDVNDN